MEIQWYPGHMAKAKRLLAESLKQIDIVIEIADARAPVSTRNPDFDELFRSKERILMLNKADLARTACTEEWIAWFRAAGITACESVSVGRTGRAETLSLIRKAAEPKVSAMLKRGIHKTVRCMIVGIPNVGKSTFINQIAGGARAKVGNRPGVTRSQQWVKISDYLELMDTPGLLWPKLDDQECARNLAWIGSIRDEVMDRSALSGGLIRKLLELDPEHIRSIFPHLNDAGTDADLLRTVAEDRNLVLKGGAPDLDRAAEHVLNRFRSGSLGRYTLERPEEQKE